ncbi:MAG: peptidylprolyl isomerase [Alphaproteobacteria bacterium]|nr:peptidylprolyl isomerase [Alphaproteobacteria bacterium]
MTVAIGEREISEAAIAAEMQYHPAATQEDAWTAAATALVVRRLLLDEAAREGLWSESPDAGRGDAEGGDAEAAIARLLERTVAVPVADEATCRRWYERNPARFRSPDLYEARHILLAAAPDDAEARAAAKARAVELIAAIAAAPERFGAFARAESACPSKDQDGHLGQFTAGTTVPELETFLAALEEGQLSPVPVETRYGVHVVRLLRRVPGRVVPFEAARERIAEQLADGAWRMAVRQYLMRLAAEADVRGIDLPRATGPLMQ